ncbi:hypothetical protein HHK36_000304 [Tetracentron sinense]|uniref:K-box domain-containing protein n=1 Tax=Tetracentron sinense TaxID=13715 RepID=A0A835A1E2_TETSI|nr:hypothetical protein HHK36_000304 [Tetracentron sinense]
MDGEDVELVVFEPTNAIDPGAPEFVCKMSLQACQSTEPPDLTSNNFVYKEQSYKHVSALYGFSHNKWFHMQQLKYEAANMTKKIEILEVSKRKLLGEGLESCSIDELQETEDQLEQSLSNIRARKNQLFMEQIEQLKEKERTLTEEYAMLREKCGVQPRQALTHEKGVVPYSRNSTFSDVETELFIGQPERATTRHQPQLLGDDLGHSLRICAI